LKKKRDFCVLHHWLERRHRNGGGVSQLCLVARSVSHPDCPERDDYQRGEVFSSGYIFTPVSATETNVTYVANMDLKRDIAWLAESLRQMLIRIVQEKQPLNVFYLGGIFFPSSSFPPFPPFSIFADF
jgi:START domain